LISYLDSHPNIHAEGELFQRLDGRTNEDILNRIFSSYPESVRAVGFKIFYYHPLDDERKEVWNILRDMRGLHIIHLKRQNVLRTLVSCKIAGASNAWTSHEETKQQGIPKQVEFTHNELSKGFCQTRDWEAEYASMFKGMPTLEVMYEDLVNGLEDEYRKITNFLGVPFHFPHSSFERQNPERLQELVVNYGEMKEKFKDSEWAEFFDEE
jgi:LPS sulfotransferase NodH